MKNSLLRIFLVLVFPLFSLIIKGQTDTLYYIYSDFEDSEDQLQWSSVPYDESIKWEFGEGGTGTNPPLYPATGNYNAIFYEPNVGTVYSRKLVSPVIDLSLAQKPQLAFQQAHHTSFNQDELYLLFKAGAASTWDTIDGWTEPVDEWTEQVYNIDQEGSQYMVSDFQFAFLAYSRSLNGVCIDSVVIVENDIIQKYVKDYAYSQVNHELIASNSVQVPLIKVRIEISGNDGPSDLEEISFRLDEGSDSYFKTNGFRLFHTADDLFRNELKDTSTQIGPAVSISSGVVTFSGLNHNLKLGNNYLWLTADFAGTIPHNSYIEFGIDANSLQVNDTLLPADEINAVFSDNIEEAVFFDNFETDQGWDITTWGGDFERTEPLGLSTVNTRDPNYTYSGTNVLGTNLTTGDGLYQTNLPKGSSYHAVSPSLDLKYYDRAKIYMRTWIDIYFQDSATISLSNDGGGTWHQVWYSVDDNLAFVPEWSELIFEEEADKYLSRQQDVQIRFSIDETGSSTRCGFNIDQFMVTGNHLETDIAVTEILSPYDDCLGFGVDTVRAVFWNYAEGNSPTNIPVFYALWGRDSTTVWDTIPGPILQGDSIVFTFSELANFPKGDIYDKFVVGVDLASDEDSRNDSLIKVLYIQNNNSSPSTEDFEYKGGVWRASEGSSWECLVSDGSIPVITESPNSWLLSPYGDYENNDTSWVVSSCYDLTSANRNIIELSYWLATGDEDDGFAIQYSINEGETWGFVDTSIFGRDWGWYTDSVSSLGDLGWSGNSGTWLTVREMLPASLATEPKVKFRIIWASDNDGLSARGVAFDDFKIYEAPADMGVSYITYPVDTCQGISGDSIGLYVKNYGYNVLNTGDTVIVGIDFESEAPVIDTFYLGTDVNPGDSVFFNFDLELNIANAGSYTFDAYTLSEQNPFFYNRYNDSITYSFDVWANPVVIMPDTIGSRQPDTLKVVPDYPAWVDGYTCLWTPGNITDSIYDVAAHGFGDTIYKVLVTEPTHGCITWDSVNVLLLFYDVGANSLLSPVVENCELLSAEQVQISIQNKGTDSLLIGDKIVAGYRVDGGAIYSDTITLTKALRANDTIQHTFSQPYDFSGITNYDLDVWAYYMGGDSLSTNDSVYSTITVYGYTPLDIGPEKLIVSDFDYTLDAGLGFDSYLWSNGDTTQTSFIDSAGVYWVSATDGNGCPGNDTIDIWFKIRDILPDSLMSPYSSCERYGPETVQVRLLNNGTDTIRTTDQIYVSYSINAGNSSSENIYPSSNILPGGTYVHTFGTVQDLSSYISYEFELVSSLAGDLRTENDTHTATVVTNRNPVINFGVADNTIHGYQYTLDAGTGANYSYLWQDNSTNQTYTATMSGLYGVEVTDDLTGCVGGDTIYLIFDILDYLISDVSLPSTECSGDFENVTVTIINNGNMNRESETLVVGFRVNSEAAIEESVDFGSATWSPGNAKIVTLSNDITLSASGNNNVSFYIYHPDDMNSSNDEFTHLINIIPSPVVDFGGDTLHVDLPYTLDAGDGFASYQWQDNSLGQTYRVSNYGLYTVSVSNASGCYTFQSVYVDGSTYVNEAAAEKLDIVFLPNPASDFLTIEANLITGEELIIELIDITGRVLFSDFHKGYDTYINTIDVSSMQKGMYYIRFHNSEIYRIDPLVIY